MYFKFNNSKSQKAPLFVYVKAEKGVVREVNGNHWTGVPKDRIEISKEEYDAAQESYDSNEPKEGDEVVVLEFVSVKNRYSKVKEIYVSGVGKSYEHRRAKLENGADWMLRDVRKKEFIHTK